MKTLTLIELEKFLSNNNNLTYGALAHEEHANNKIENLQYSGCRITTTSYDRVIFENCEFFGCHFRDAIFSNCLFINCKFHFTHMANCNFSGCAFENSDLSCSTFTNCSVEATELDAHLSEVLVQNLEESLAMAA